MTERAALSALFLYTLMSFAGLSHAEATPGKARQIFFPNKVSLGTVELLPMQGQGKSKLRLVPAKGRVDVPSGCFVKYWNNENIVQNPALLDELKPDDIDEVMFRYSAFADGEEGLADKAIAHFRHLTGLSRLNLERSDASDAGLKNLDTLKNLEFMSCYMTAVNGSSLESLTKLNHLTGLDLSHCAIKAANFRYIANFHGLNYLNLTRTGMGDRELAALSHLKKLRHLSISENPGLTDQCTKVLAGLNGLKIVNLRSTGITMAGLASLKGMNLKLLDLPAKFYSPKEKEILKTWFPKTKVRFEDRMDQAEKDDVKTILAPVSR